MLHDVVLQIVALFEHLLKVLLVLRHTAIELLFSNIYIFDFYIEVLPGTQRIFLILDVIEGYDFREVIHFFLRLEGLHDLLDFEVSQLRLLVAVNLDFLSKFRSIYQDSLSTLVPFVYEDHTDIGTCIGKNV